MKRYIIKRGHTWQTGLDVQDVSTPTPGEHEVLVRMRAAALNHRDLGTPNAERDTVPLSDGAGEVVAVGRTVTRLRVGDRAVANFFPYWADGSFRLSHHDTSLGGSADGVLAEYIALPEQAWLHLPMHLSYEEGATLPVAGVTAWHALCEVEPIKSGDDVLLIGTGGVSIFALQFAKLAGARAILVTSRREKLERAKALGADHVIDSRANPDWHRAVLDLTGGEGVAHVIEVGGAGTLERSFAASRGGGHIKLIGVLAKHAQENGLDPLPVIVRSLTVNGIFVGSCAMFARMNRAMGVAQLRPVIHQTFEFDQIHEAFSVLQSGELVGKLVIRIA